MENKYFLWLQLWCEILCEKCIGNIKNRVQLKTLDNPGWLLTINLQGTSLEKIELEEVKFERSDNDWLFCIVRNNQFEGACGPTNLIEVLKIFHDWAGNRLDEENKQRLSINQSNPQAKKSEFEWLQYWFYIHCNGDWEHSFGIQIEMLETPEWLLKISLEDTELENKIFQKIEVVKNVHDWVTCLVRNNQFEGACSLTNLHKVIKIFRDWAVNILERTDQKLLDLLANKGIHFIEQNELAWLQTWYYIHFNSDSENGNRIKLETLDGSGWLLTINVKGTELATKEFHKIKIDSSDDNWLLCDVKDSIFEGRCSPINLLDLLKVFHNWAK